MSLVTYEDVRPWARAIKQRTGIGPKAGVMPPWYVEKNIGIQKFKNDPSLSDDEIAKIAKWADSGAPRGNPADMPPPKQYADDRAWAIGTPDLIVKMQDVVVKGERARLVGRDPERADRAHRRSLRRGARDQGSQRRRLARPAAAAPPSAAASSFHHMIWRTQVLDGKTDQAQDPLAIFSDEERVNWPVHEVGRNADFFDPKSARLLKAGSSIVSDSVHLHSNGRDTKAHLEIGFKLDAEGLQADL